MAKEKYQTDEVLLLLLKEDDQQAFSELYNRYWEELLNIAYKRLLSKESAEEVVQEVFVQLYLRRKELKLTGTFRTYLLTAIRFKIIDLYRTKKLHEQYVEQFLQEKEELSVPPDHEKDDLSLPSGLSDLIGQLPPKCQEAFMLTRFGELSHQEVASRMQISISTVKKHIHKALKFLRVHASQ